MAGRSDMVLYDTKCSFTGTQVRFWWKEGGKDVFPDLYLLARYSIGKTQVTAGDGFVVKKRAKKAVVKLKVDVEPIDALAYMYAALLRWKVVATCRATDESDKLWYVTFRSLAFDRYPGHCMIVHLDDGEGEGNKCNFFLTATDVVRVRDVFYRAMLRYEGVAVIDSVIFTHTKQMPRIRISGGPEIFLTRIACERLIQTINEIVAMKQAGKNRLIGVKHGAVGVNNQVAKKFALVNLLVGGMSIPLDWLSTVRLLVHLSAAAQKIPEEPALFYFDTADEIDASDEDEEEVQEVQEEGVEVASAGGR